MAASKKPAGAPKRPRKPQVRQAGQGSLLDDLGLDAICERMRRGESQLSIASSLGITRAAIYDWSMRDPARRAAMDQARIDCAEAEDDLALDAIRSIPRDATPGDIARAREEASHRRWRARVRDPRRYGDRQQIDLDATVRNLDDAELNAEIAALVAAAKSQPDDASED